MLARRCNSMYKRRSGERNIYVSRDDTAVVPLLSVSPCSNPNPSMNSMMLLKVACECRFTNINVGVLSRVKACHYNYNE